MEHKIIIAIDGHSACGKSTTARLVARALGYIFIDTGAMYRAVTLSLLEQGIPTEIETPALRRALEKMQLEFRLNTDGVPEMYLDGRNVEAEIRSMRVSAQVSEVSAIPLVRRAMVKQQQEMGQRKGVVMDGRDIGTVVFPQAELKIFMTASTGVRVQRRMEELLSKGISMPAEEVRANLEHRDHIDSNREDSPLRKADDALVLDNSTLSVEEQVQFVLARAAAITGVLNAR